MHAKEHMHHESCELVREDEIQRAFGRSEESAVQELVYRAAQQIPVFCGNANGRGIIIVLPDGTSDINIVIGTTILRRLGCNLPIEVWCSPDRTVPSSLKAHLSQFDLSFRSVAPKRTVKGLGLRLSAILDSGFREVLAIDAEVLAVRSPEYLFDSEHYRQTGAIFWHDRATWDCRLHRILRITTGCCEPKFSDAIVCINRIDCWEGLYLASELIQRLGGTRGLLFADVDALKAAWHVLGQPFASCSKLPELLSSTDPSSKAVVACYEDLREERLFQRRTGEQWRLLNNPHIPGALLDSESRTIIAQVRNVLTRSCIHDSEVPSSVSEQLIGAEWILQFEEQLDAISEIPLVRERYTVRFQPDGIIDASHKARCILWSLTMCSGRPRLALSTENGTTVARFDYREGCWRQSPPDCNREVRAGLQPLHSAVAGSRVPIQSEDFPFPTRDYVVCNSSANIGDHIASVYACTGAVRCGAAVTFITPFAEWLSTVAEPGLNILQGTGEDGAILFGRDTVLDLDSDHGACERLGWSSARWHASQFAPELMPATPATRETEGKNADPLGLRKFIVLAPCATDPADDWLAAHWIRLIALLRDSGYELVAIGAGHNEQRLAEICSETNAFWVVNDSPKWLSAVLRRSDLVIAGINPIAHLAGLLRVNTIVLQSQFPAQFYWDCTNVISIIPDAPCTLCRRQRDNGYEASCSETCSILQTVNPYRVYEAARTFVTES